MAIFGSDQKSGEGVVEKHEYATDELPAGHGLTATNVCACRFTFTTHTDH